MLFTLPETSQVRKEPSKQGCATNWFFGSLAEWNNCGNNQVNLKLSVFGFHAETKRKVLNGLNILIFLR